MTELQLRGWLREAHSLRQEVRALRRIRERALQHGAEESAAGSLAFCMALERQIERLREQEQAILQAITGVADSRLRTVLTERYLGEQTWEQIADRMDYCVVQVCRLHKQALRTLAGTMELPQSMDSAAG